jgi:hypothetical protein
MPQMKPFYLMSFFVIASAVGQCVAPQVEDGAIFVDDATTLIKSVSIEIGEFTARGLVCLGEEIRARYADRQIVSVYIYTSPDAAAGSITKMEYDESDLEQFRQLHAIYSLDRTKGEEVLKILPAGAGMSSTPRDGLYSTTIKFPGRTAPHCEMEIDNRCLIDTHPIVYPNKGLSLRILGDAVLEAVITKAGKVDRIRIVKAESKPGGAELAGAVELVLSSWRFEPGSSDRPLKITFTYQIDDSLRYTDGAKVDWHLPDKITIRQKPRG